MRIRDHAIGLFVLFHLFNMTVPNIPPGELGRSAPAWQRSIQDVWNPMREGTLRGIEPYWRFLGTKQNWTMFGYLGRRGSRLEIEILRNDKWEAIYVQGEARHWNQRALCHYRFRHYLHLIRARRRRDARQRCLRWMAPYIFAAYPDAGQVRMKVMALRVQLPREPLHRGIPWEVDSVRVSKK